MAGPVTLACAGADIVGGAWCGMTFSAHVRFVSVVAAFAIAAGCAARGPAVRVAPGGATVIPEASPSVVRRVIDTAYALVGSPYRLGGADPAGFDCSGFVSYVFGRAGVGLPRTVAALATIGVSVPDGHTAPGDLVFFATASTSPSHVAIALGHGRFVHAPSSRGVVRIERLDADYWARRYAGARRVLGTPQPREANEARRRASG